MFKILTQLYGLTLAIQLKEKQRFVSSWDIAASNSSIDLTNTRNSSFKNLLDSTPVNLTSNQIFKSDIPIKNQEVKLEQKDLQIQSNQTLIPQIIPSQALPSDFFKIDLEESDEIEGSNSVNTEDDEVAQTFLDSLKQVTSGPFYQIIHQESKKCLTWQGPSKLRWDLSHCADDNETDNLGRQIFIMKYDITSHSFQPMSIFTDNYIDLEISDDIMGLVDTENATESKVYLLPPPVKKEKDDKKVVSQNSTKVVQDQNEVTFDQINKVGQKFYITDELSGDNMRYLVAVDDGRKPTVWVTEDKPNNKNVVEANFLFEFRKL